MQPLDEIDRTRLSQLTYSCESIDFRLDTHVSGRFDLEIATLPSAIEVSCQRTLDVTGTCVVPFDEVAVVTCS